MKRAIVAATVLSMALATSAFARTSINVGLNLGNAPPPPVVVYRQPPRWVATDPGVYVVQDDNIGYDYFRYGGFYYIYDSGYWYRSSRYRGPFRVIETRYVPRPIYYVGDRDYRWRSRPVEYERYHRNEPPGWSHGKARWKNGRGGDDQGDHGHGHGDHGDH